MYRNRTQSLIALLISVIVIAGCQAPSTLSPSSGAPTAAEPTAKPVAVTMRLSRGPDGVNSPLFLALERGYFREKGLEVTILPGGGGTTAMTLVANGNDTFAWGGAAALMEAASQGLPVKHVVTLLQKSPESVVSLESAGIKTPKDLEGKTVLLAPGDSQGPLMRPFFIAQGVDPAKVTIVSAEFGAQPALIATGKADAVAAWCFGGTPNALTVTMKQKLSCMWLSDYGFNILGQGIIANSFYMKQNPKVVEGFVQATVRGFTEASKDPAAAIKALMQRCPNCSEAVETHALTSSIATYHTQRTQTWTIGKASPEDWEDAKKLLSRFGSVNAGIPSDVYYDYAYIP